jgi:N-acetylmuramoyl-L-alanine amidase
MFYRFSRRANIARANATIFVSIHCNANKNTADGTDVMGVTMKK